MTADFFALPRAVPLSAAGKVISGAKLTFYLAGTSTLKAVFADSGLTTALTNPVSADANGQFPAIFLNNDADYKVRLTDSNDVLLYEEDNIAGGLTAAQLNSIIDTGFAAVWEALNPPTTGETAENSAILNPQRDPGDIRRYGTNTTPGTTDMTSALQEALDAHWYVTIPDEDHRITSEIDVPAGRVIAGTGPNSKLTFVGSMANSNLLDLGSNSKITIRDLTLVGDQTSDAAQTNLGCAIFGNGASEIRAERLNISGFPQSGILLRECTDFWVKDCLIDDIAPATSAPGAVAGINIENDASRGKITGNTISNIGNSSGNGQGIRLIVQTSGNATPTKITIAENLVENTQGHGIVYYDGQDSNVTDSLGAVIKGNITRRTGLQSSGEEGNGIYLLGVSNASITGNTVYEPHVNTTGTNIGRAGIVASAFTNTVSRNIQISGNGVYNSGHDGIRMINVQGGTISGNTIDTWANNGIQIGGATASEGCESVSVTGNSWVNTTDQVVFFHGLPAGTACVSEDCYAEVFATPNRASNQEPFIRNYGTGCTVNSKGSAEPDAGTWGVADKVYNTAPAAGGTIGWVCTTAGTPGTWKTWGDIAA